MPKTAATVKIAIVVALAGAAGWLLSWNERLHHFFDLKIYVSAMRWWADGNPLYDYAQPDRVQGALYFTYPPFTALLLRPFAEIPLGATITIFTVGSAVAIAVTTWWLITPIADRRGLPRWFAAAVSIPLVFAIEPNREMIALGQINMLLVVLVLADLLIAVPRNSRWAGVGIGLATAIKLFPGIFIVYLLVTRRWRAAIAASAAAAGATLLAAAVVPRDSWRFWAQELWATDRVGRTDYTGNQSLLGLLGRLTAPEDANRLLWLALVALVLGYGMWRAAAAGRAGDELAGLALTGLVAALISPITWTHHVYWFVPALIVLVDAGLPASGRRVRPGLIAVAVIGYATIVYGVVSFVDWGVAREPTDSIDEFLRRNAYVLLTALLITILPVRGGVLDYPRRALERTDLTKARDIP